MKKPAKYSLGVRLSLLQALLIVVVMALFTQTLTTFLTKRLEKQTLRNLTQQGLRHENVIS